MWSYMMKHVLVAKNVWQYVCGNEVRPPSPLAAPVDGEVLPADPPAGSSCRTLASMPEQQRWESKMFKLMRCTLMQTAYHSTYPSMHHLIGCMGYTCRFVLRS